MPLAALGRLQSGTFRRIVSEANRDPDLSQVSQRGLACRAVPCVSCRIGRRTEGDDEAVRAAETSLVSILREHLARSDDARTLVRQIFQTEADLIPDMTNKTLTVQIHHLTQAAHDQVLEKLCAALNETQTVFPGTDLTLIFKIGSSQF